MPSFVTAAVWVGFLTRELCESLTVSGLLVVRDVSGDPVDDVFPVAAG